MEKNIVKNGTKVILFALGTEDTNVTGVITAEDALRIADKFGLKAEVQRELNNGATPLEALREWDII